MGSTDNLETQPRSGDVDVTFPTAYTHTKDLFLPPTQAEWDILYYALALKGRGSPIHRLDPPMEQPTEYRKVGYGIGDVVLLDFRGFVDFHFNTCVAADSPFNGRPRNIPDGFSPLYPPLDPANIYEDAPFKGHTVLDGKSVRTFQIPGHSPGTTFDAVAEEMTILTIPDGVISGDVIDVSCFRKYIAANAVGWYKHVNEVGSRYATNGDLRIVVGWDRCSSWSRVVTSSVRVRIPQDNLATTGSFAHFNAGFTTSGTGLLHSLEGKRRVRDPESVVHQNQSVFLRTLNISVCDAIWSKLAEDCRPHVDLDMRPLPEGTVFKWTSHSIDTHPANGINALLLKQKPHAKYAITQDSDWISVLKPDDPSLPTANEFLSRILKIYNVCEEDDVVFLEYKPEVLYRTYLTHDHDISLTLPLWHPAVVAVGTVGYFCKDGEKFITLFDACAPTIPAISSLSSVRNKITQKNHGKQSMKSRAFDLLSSLLNLGRKSCPPRRAFFPLKVGEKAAHIYTGPSRHRRFQADDLPIEWLNSNIDKIVETYGADHNITREDVVLITGTLETQDYALFVSACHREGSVIFDVNLNPKIGQPWGNFLPGSNGQFSSKVSQHGGPWQTVLVSCLRVVSNPVVPST